MTMTTLRLEAERRLANGEPAARAFPSAQDELIYELQVHEVELQMQNEALCDAQAELEASRARYRELFELSPAGIVLATDEGRILEANRAAAELFGVAQGELVGRGLQSFLTEVSILQFTHHRLAARQAGGLGRCEVEVVPLQGPRRDVRMVSRRAGNGAWHTVLLDVTEVNALQRRLAQAQKLESLGTLAAGVAHDFNNMLTAILGCGELIRSQLETGHAARGALDDLLAAARRGTSITKQLLVDARGDQAPASTDLHGALHAGRPVLQGLVGEGVSIELVLRATRPVVRMDHGLLDQVLMNLVRNAGEAMAGSGRLRIETFDATAGEEGRCLLTVTDTGCGMTPEVQARVFEPFFTTKPPRVGTGLGLWMVHGAVTQAGGQVSLDSTPGAGTTVKVFLRCSELPAVRRD
jgi:PAS domain S-box-containing protein